jgi:predicted RNA-binding Zn-ribbon protein involved in translation (DUF1610 family)
VNRKQRRAMKKELKKQHGVEDEMAEKMIMFDRMPDECSSCTKPFDKKDRDMVFSWNVVVRHDEQQVRLYCPTCWDAAQTAIKQVYGELDDTV